MAEAAAAKGLAAAGECTESSDRCHESSELLLLLEPAAGLALEAAADSTTQKHREATQVSFR